MPEGQRTYNNSFTPSLGVGRPAPIKLAFPGHVNNFLKESYNKSTIGLADQLINGAERHDLSQYEYGTLFDVGTTVLSFIGDIPAYLTGAGFASVALKGAGKQTVKRVASSSARNKMKQNIGQASKILADNGANPTYINQVQKQLTKTFVDNGDRLLKDSSGFSVISGTHEMLRQGVNDEDYDWLKGINKAIVGAVVLPAGKVGGIAATNIVGKKSPILKGALGLAGESAGFVAPYSWSEGNLMPNPQDLGHTIGLLGGINLLTRGRLSSIQSRKGIIEETNAAFGNKNAIKFKDRPENIKIKAGEALERDIAAKKASDVIRGGEQFWSKDGSLVSVVEKGLDTITYKSAGLTKPKTVPSSEFYKEFNIVQSKKAPRFELVRSIGRELDTLGINDTNQIRKIVFGLRNGNVPKGLKPSDRGLGSLTERELYQLNKKLSQKSQLEKFAQELAAVEVEYSRQYLPGVFGGISRAFDKLTLDGFTIPVLGKRIESQNYLSGIRSVEAKLSKPGVALEAKHLMYQVSHHADYSSQIAASVLGRLNKIPGANMKNMTDKKLMKLVTEELETNVGITSNMSNIAKEMRSIYDDLYKAGVKEGLDMKAYQGNYAGRFLQEDLADLLRNFRADINRKEPRVYAGVDKIANDPEVVSFLQNKLSNILKDNAGNKPLQTYFKSLKQQYGNDVVKIFTDMDRHLIQKKSRPFSNIDKSRTGNVSWVPGKGYNIPIFEENAYANILNYTNQMANQLATKKFFGTNYQNAIQLIDDVSTGKVGKTADRATADTMKELMLRVTGAIELDPSRNLSPKNKEFVRQMVNFEIGTKIGGGLATIVNITQPLISSLFLGNYRVGIPGYMKRFVSGDRKALLKEMGLYGDSQFLNTMEVLTGTSKRGNTLSDRIVGRLTKLTGFTGMNRLNLETSASVGIDMMRYLNRVANGENVLLKNVPLSASAKKRIINDTLAGQSRTAWAKRKLSRDYGVTWTGKKEIGMTELTQGAIRFAKDTQLQRNLLKEPLFLTEPMFRPLLVLKTFGIKQSQLISKGLGREVREGNVLPVARLAIGAGIGGKFIINSYEFMQNLLSGKDEYDWRRAKQSFSEMKPGFISGEENYKRADYWTELLTPTMEELAAVGTMGVVTDFMSADNKMGNLGYILEPVIWDDVTTVWNGLTSIFEDVDDYGVSGAMKRSPQNFSKLLGSNIKNLTRRLETDRQSEGRIESQRRRVHREIVKDVYQGKNAEAKRKIISWNTAHPDQPLLQPNAEEILSYVYKQRQKKENP